VGQRPIAVGLRAGLAGAVAAAASACSSFDPQVGPSQESCGVEALGATTATTSAGYGYGTTTSRMTPTTCQADAGSACDDCESEWCCSTRLPCYEDPVCACADHALDACTAAAGSNASAVGACWSTFANVGTVEAARVACEVAWCKQACAIP
jgi:hypothetical protein